MKGERPDPANLSKRAIAPEHCETEDSKKFTKNNANDKLRN